MRRGRRWGIALTIVMLLQLALPSLWVKAVGQPFPFDMQVAVTDLQGKPLGVIARNAEIRITYLFSVPDDEDVEPGVEYSLRLPDELVMVPKQTIQLDGTDPDDGSVIPIATVTIDADGWITIVFSNDAADLSEVRGSFRIERRFDQTKIHDQDVIEFDVGVKGTVVIPIEFEQIVVVKPSITKKYVDYQAGEITWEITVHAGSETVENVVVEDVHDVNQAFVAGSVLVDGGSTTDCDYLAGTLTCLFPGPFSGEQVITYSTEVLKPVLGSATIQGLTITNAAGLEVDGTYIGSDSDSYTLDTEWVEKSGRLVQVVAGEIEECESSQGNLGCEIEWTITVNPEGNWIPADTTVIDSLPLFLSFVDLSGSMFVDGVLAGPISVSPLSTDFTYTFISDTDSVYDFVFRTEIDPSYYTQQGQTGFDNAVTLEAPDGSSTTGTADVGVTGSIGAPTSLIHKRATGYNAATQEISWAITVNSNKVAIADAVVTDPLGPNHVLIEDTIRIGNQSPDPSQYDIDEDGLFTVRLGTLNSGNSPVTMTFSTKVIRPDHFAANGTEHYANTAELTGGGITKSTSTASQPVASEVIRKSSVTYDYTTQEITWNIVVNNNRMPMTNVTVTDIIPAGQAFVPGSVTFDTAPPGWTSSHESGTLTIELGDITERHGITFRTKVVDTAFFAQNQPKAFGNTATLTFGVPGYVYPGNVTVPATQLVRNTFVEKKALAIDRTEAYIDWEVVLNTGLLTLTGASVSDTLQPGLELDTGSIKLYKGALDPITGTVTADLAQEVPLSWVAGPTSTTGSVTYRQGQFTLSLPTPTASVYVLNFRTDLVESFAGVANELSFSGAGFLEQSAVSQNWSFDLSGVGAGRNGSITVIKVDAADGTTRLPGAVFELLDHNGNVLREGTTNASGEVVFDKLKFRSFSIREKKAPLGYQLSDEVYPFTVTSDPGQQHISYTFTNETLKGRIEFTKVTHTGSPLARAEFDLYRKGENVALATAVSGANGKVVFDNLERGEYRISETKAPSGYIKSDDEFDVEIRLNGEILEVLGVPLEVANTRRPYTPTGPWEPEELDEPIELEEPIEPGEPTEPKEPTQPEAPTPPEEPIDSGKPTEPTKPTDAGRSTQPAKPTESGESTGSEDSAEASQSLQGGESIGSENVSQPGETESLETHSATLPASGGMLDTRSLTLIGVMLVLVGTGLAVFARKRQAGFTD